MEGERRAFMSEGVSVEWVATKCGEGVEEVEGGEGVEGVDGSGT